MNNLLTKITPILEWIKTNPLLMFCGIIILLSIGSFFWPTQYYSSAFRTQLESRDGEVRQLQNFSNTSVDLPPIEPDDPPRTIKTIAKKKVTDSIADVYAKMAVQHDEIFKFAVAENQRNHTLLVEGLFPEPGEEGEMLPYTVREAYTKSFARLYQQLDAGSAPDADEAKALLEHDEESFRSRFLLGATGAMTDTQKSELTRIQAQNLLKLYMSNAAKHHLYADPVVLVTGGSHPTWKPGPFQVQDWARQGKKPLQAELWAGQMDLWIQQDLCTAIAITNRVSDPAVSLADCPVKRLLSLKVRPDYIGLVKLPPGPPVAPNGPPGLPAFPDDKTIREQLNKRLIDNFTASATGRITNYLYDVRGASMSVIVESRRIPEFLNALGQVNFITIVGMGMKDIDEFEALRNGYWYGDCDVVQLDLEVESIWLRNWTAGHFSKEDAAAHPNEKENPGLMPESVRVSLGIKPWNQEKYLQSLMPRTGGVVPK